MPGVCLPLLFVHLLLVLGRLSACPYLRPSFCSSVCPFICLSDCLSDRRTDFCSLSVFLIVCLSFVFIWRSFFLTLFLLVSLSVCLLVCLSVRLRVCLCVRQDFSLFGGLFVCAYVCPAICFFLFVRIFVFFCLSLCLTVWLSVSAFALSLSAIQVLSVSCALFTSCGVMCCLSVCPACPSVFYLLVISLKVVTFYLPILFCSFLLYLLHSLSTHNHHSYLYEVTDEA